MAKVGISVKIDVTKINKERLFKGQKGVYLDLTTFVDLDNVDDYGNNGFIAQSVSKDEREQGVKGEILGNVRVFFSDSPKPDSSSSSLPPQQGQQEQDKYPDDIPF